MRQKDAVSVAVVSVVVWCVIFAPGVYCTYPNTVPSLDAPSSLRPSSVPDIIICGYMYLGGEKRGGKWK